MSSGTQKLGSIGTDTRKVAYAVVLVAIGVALAPYTSFPVGIAEVNPTQHFVNVVAAVDPVNPHSVEPSTDSFRIFTAAHCRWYANVGSFCASVYT
jgi:hypothetical protein